jgi:hypothetical protein
MRILVNNIKTTISDDGIVNCDDKLLQKFIQLVVDVDKSSPENGHFYALNKVFNVEILDEPKKDQIY